MNEFSHNYRRHLKSAHQTGQRRWRFKGHILVVFLGLSEIATPPGSVLAQNPAAGDRISETDIPEEILEAEIILEGRSPIDGEPLTPAEYAQLEDELRISRGEVPGRLAPQIHRALVLLRLRKLIGTLFPFLL